MGNAVTNKQLLESILDGQGIKNTHFFNGRILTADDLKTEQNANRRQHEQLGQAIGTGIVSGLEVSLVADGADGTPPVISVSEGLALNGKGQAAALPSDVKIALSRQIELLPVEADLFSECQPPKTGTVPRDRGAYIFVATPTSGFSELAPVRGFSDGKVIGCGSRYAVEGIKFRLEELKITGLTGLSQATRDAVLELMKKSDIASLSKLRNWLAHICFGTEELSRFLRDPFARLGGKLPNTNYGVIDALRANGQLTDCDVPLALLYWAPGGVQFLDMWAVRRRLAEKSTNMYPFLPRNNHPTIAEAMIEQFQQQVNDLITHKSLSGGKLSALRMVDLFRYLPPGGAVPLTPPGEPGGFSWQTFFTALAYRDPVYIEGAVVESLYREALAYPPLDLEGNEFFWLYYIRENSQAVVSAGNPVAPILTVFARGNLSYRGNARFNQSHWDYSNVSSQPVF